jgi:hypothetical protein
LAFGLWQTSNAVARLLLVNNEIHFPSHYPFAEIEDQLFKTRIEQAGFYSGSHFLDEPDLFTLKKTFAWRFSSA